VVGGSSGRNRRSGELQMSALPRRQGSGATPSIAPTPLCRPPRVAVVVMTASRQVQTLFRDSPGSRQAKECGH
jgi:hypothetical protein